MLQPYIESATALSDTSSHHIFFIATFLHFFCRDVNGNKYHYCTIFAQSYLY